MTKWRIYIFSILAVCVASTAIGFFISVGSGSQVAYARLLIDVGSLIAVAILALGIPKPKVTDTQVLLDAIRDLRHKRYDTRIQEEHMGDFDELAHAINALANHLEESHAEHKLKSAAEISARIMPQGHRPIINPLHSHHPELGQVRSVAATQERVSTQEPAVAMPEGIFAFSAQSAEYHQSHYPEQLSSSGSGLQEIQLDPPPPAPAHYEASEEERMADLYDAYSKALHALGFDLISFDTFKETIDKAKSDLMAAHHCKDVHFDVVTENDDVALRPRLVR